MNKFFCFSLTWFFACGSMTVVPGSLTEASDAGEGRDASVAVATEGGNVELPKDAGVTEDAGNRADAGVMNVPYFRHVFVVMMENQNDTAVYESPDAPYINGLMKQYAWAARFEDVLPKLPSEPHYIWLEAGTHAFADHTFTNDDDASEKNSTSSTQHLSTLLDAKGLDWVAYQEGIGKNSGACPIASDWTTAYAAKHNPFVYFQDVSGTPPSKDNARCAAHNKPFDELATDLSQGKVPAYALITPNQCHDMHGAVTCPSQLLSDSAKVKAADAWLSQNLPPLIEWALANQGLVLLVWDEPQGTTGYQPFVIIAEGLKSPGYASQVPFDLSAVLKSLQRIFQVSPKENVPYLGHAADVTTNDLSDFFLPGYFP